ncbi:MAG: hypothetical protein K8F91_17430 [Candidatus Obscuribacterales bacterium]|nr:hypothetical protein [Candidatus Obscuribacterales bacterium]
MSDNNTNKLGLLCSQCQFPITSKSAALGFVRCPRCNTRADLAVNCATSCQSCHKSATTSCSDEIAQTGEIYPQNGEQIGKWAYRKPVGLLVELLKNLRNRIFPIR